MTRKTPRKQANSRSQRRRPLTSNRARPTFRHRRLLGEWLENRLLLAAFARFDFDDTAIETSPVGWTRLLDTNAIAGTTDLASGIGIKLESAIGFGGVGTTYAPSTVPSDITLIRNGFQRTGLSGEDPNMSFLVTNLDSQKSYEVWVLGGNLNTGPTQTQHIKVEGQQETTFNQNIASSELWVNGSVGSSAMPLENFAPIFVAAPFHFDLNDDGALDNHVIRVRVTKSIGSTAAQVAGIAIREALPTSFTLPPTGSPFSLLVEGDNRVVKNCGGMLLATLANTGAITINGTAAASDDLNINLSGGNPLTGGVTFNGGLGVGTGAGDKLTITGGDQGTVTYNYTNANDGSVVMSNFGTVNYTGLEPITNTGTATNVIFNLPATSDFAFLEDNGATPADNMLRLRSAPTSFELTDFAIPTGTLTVNLGGGADSLTVSAVPQFSAGLTINGGTGDDAIFLNSTIAFASNRNLNVDLQDDDLVPGVDTINMSAGAVLTLSGSGAATLKASKSIVLAPGSSIVTASGPIGLAANQQLTPTAGDFIGIDIVGGTIKTTSGPITLSGRGGTGPAAQVGVYVRGAAVVGDATTGAVTITGRGGDAPTGSSGGNSGVLVQDASRVSTGGGNIDITGVGGTDAGDVGSHYGVGVDQSTVNAVGAGTLTINGTSAGPESIGIQVTVGAQALKTANGTMTLIGTGETGVEVNGALISASADIEVTGTSTTAVNDGIRQAGNLETVDAGNIKLIADKMNLEQRIDAQTRTVTLVPKTAGRAIDLGSLESPTHLGILDIEQSVITAGTLNIGDATSGPITVSNDILRPPTLPIVANVNLTSGGAISFASGQLDSAGASVTLSPGVSTAASFANTGTDLIVGSAAVAFSSGADAAFAINGTTAETQYEVLTVTGNLNLSGTDLVVSGSYTPTAGNTFAIVKYTGSRTGMFNNSSVTLNGQTLNVVYDDANKRVLLELPGTPTLSATLAGDSLTIADTDAVGKNNNLTVSASSGNLVISDATETFISAPPGGTLSNGNKTLTIPFATVTGVLTINTEGGNDTLTVDFAGGNVTTNTIIYNGGAQSGTPGDILKLVGGTFVTITHNFAGATTGTIFLDGHTVSYSGLEPVDMSGTTATNLVFNLPSASSNAFLEDDGTIGNSISQIRSTNNAFEATTFSNPSGSLTINRGNAADTLTANALPDFTASLTIGSAAAPLNNVTFVGAFTLGPDKNLSVHAAGTIALEGAQADLQASSTGAISLTTTSNISLSIGSSIVTQDGDLSLSANQQVTPTSGNFTGIELNAATLQVTGTGDLELFGRGGDSGTLTSNFGVSIHNSASVSAGSTGTVTVQGVGGPGSAGSNYSGVFVSGSTIGSIGGNVQVTGQGGGSEAALANSGVLVDAGQITAGGMGTVTVEGTGGPGTGTNNYGVWVRNLGARITSSGGNVQVTGQGGGSGTSFDNVGVLVWISGEISAGGSGEVTVQGTGGPASGGFNYGVGVSFDGLITSSGGNVQVLGQGGGATTSGTNIGVSISSGQVSAGGNGQVIVQGTGGVGTSGGNDGVSIGSSSLVSGSGSGAVTVQGSGGAGLTSFGNHGVSVSGAGSAIASGGGDVQVTGQASGGSAGFVAGAGVRVEGSGQISAGGSGLVSVQGTGSGEAGSTSHGVLVFGDGSSVSSSGGNVEVTGIEGASSSSVAIVTSDLGAISTAAGGGTLALIGNSMLINGPSTISASPTSSVTLRPFTAGVAIHLGTGANLNGGPLGLSDGELDRITAGRIIVGSPTSGAVTFIAPVGLDNSSTLEIITGSTINDAGATTVFTDTNLALAAAAGIGTTSPLNIAISNLAAAGGTGGVNVSDTGNLAVTTVAGVVGATATDSNITISAGSSITVDQPITATGSGGIDLAATSGSITVNASLTAGTAGVTLKSDTGIQLATAAADITSSGPIDINSDFDANAIGTFNSVTDAKIDQTGIDIPVTVTASDISLSGTIDSSGILTLQPSTPFRSIAIHDNVGSFHLDPGELTRAAANGGGLYTIGRIDGTGEIRIGGNGSVQLPNGDFSFRGGNVTFNGPLLLPFTAPTLEIIASGEIQQTFGGNAITNATSLVLDSASGVGALANPLRVAAGQSLAARASVSGPVAIASTDSLTSRALGNLNGISSNGGTIQLEAFNLRVGLTNIGLGPINAGSGAVNITTTSNSFGTSGGLIINDAVTAGSDSIFNANSLFLNSTGSVNVGSSALTIQPSELNYQIDLGGNDISGTTLGIDNAELDRIVAGTLRIGQNFRGQITISAPINVANNPTPIPTLHLFSQGSVIDANAAGIDLTAANLSFNAANGPAGSDNISTQASNLSANYSNVGNFKISNAGPLTITTIDGTSGVDTLGGDIDITADGPLTVLSSSGATFGDVFLTAAGDDQLLRIDAPLSGTGNATLTADKMSINSVVDFFSLKIAPENTADPGDAIDLGSTTDAAANTLALSPAELARLRGDVRIGDIAAGPINITGNNDRILPVNYFLESSEAINFTTGSLDTAGGNLVLTPGPDDSVGVATAGLDVTLDGGTLNFAPGSDLFIAINGTTVDTQYHQLNVAGQIDLNGVDFAVSLGFSPAGASPFVIVNNDGTDPIVGTFNGLPDGQLFTIGGTLVQINYSAGTGNDVVLTAVDPSDPSLQGTSGDDNWLVRRAAADVEILLNGAVILVTPFASLSRIRLDGLAGNDTLTVDLASGDAIPPNGINFSGGDPTTAPGDKLVIAGGAQGTVTYNYTNAHDGSIVMSNFGTVTFTGLEPILNTGAAADVIFNLPATANDITLGDDGTTSNGRSRLSGPTIETTDFTNPTNSLAINPGNSADLITVGSLPDLNSGLAIGSPGNIFAGVVVAGTVSLAADKNFVVRASGTISLPNAVSDVATLGTGAMVLTTSRDISLAAGSSITTVNGNLTLSANQQVVPTSGDFAGVRINGSTVESTGSGNVTVMGSGGNAATGFQFGVRVEGGGILRGGLTGATTIVGRAGGSGGDNNSGVSVNGAGSVITSLGGNVSVTGFGGAGVSFNRGVVLFGGGKISAGGAGTVAIEGTGGQGSFSASQGVLADGAGSAISSNGGDVTIIGTGGGAIASSFNVGVSLLNGGAISTLGAADLQIQGTGGSNTSSSSGVGLAAGTSISVGGDISILGATVSNTAPGVSLGGSIIAAAAGDVNVTAITASIQGVISTTGAGTVSVTTSRSIALSAGASITTVNGDLTLSANQQATPSTGGLTGIDINEASVRSTGTGNVTVAGRGGTTGAGIRVTAGAVIEGGTSGLVSVTGTAGSTFGVDVRDAGSRIGSTGADILVTGFGGANGGFPNDGVRLFSGGQIAAGGSGTVTVQGTGGNAPTDANNGVFVTGANSRISSTSGNVTVIGTGGGTGAATSNNGISTSSGGSLHAGGSGTLQLIGTAGNSAAQSGGVVLGDVVTTDGGDITITGTAVNDAANGVSFFEIVAPGPGGNVLVVSDRIGFALGSGINAPSQTVTLRPKTAGRAIDLAGPDVPAALHLFDGELDRITAGTLQIGDSTSGPINITANITRPALTNVNLTSGDSINFTTGSINTAGGNLLLTPGASSAIGVANSGIDANLGPTGAIAFAPGSDLAIAINGTTVDTEYHQLNVTGGVNLTGVDLALSGSFAPSIGSTFTIVSNDAADAITGTFTGLPQGHRFTATVGSAPIALQITYQGGDGNDVVLTVVDPTNPNLAGTPGDDNWLVQRIGPNLEVRLNTLLILTAPFAGLNSLSFDGLAGNDSLTVDLATGDAIPPSGISFIGGDSTTSSGDKLIIAGGDQGTVNYFYDTSPFGFVSMSNFGPIVFNALESILNTGAAVDATINLFGPGGAFTLADDGTPANNLTRISGPNIQTTDFTNPTNSLTINRGNPADSLTISSLPDFNSTLTIGSAAAPLNNVTFNGPVTLAPDKSLSVQATGTIRLQNSQADLQTSGTGSVSLTTTRNITLSSGTSITTVNGNVTLSANQQALPTTGDFVGIDLLLATVQTTGSGNLALFGRGGNSLIDDHGIRLENRAKLISTSTNLDAGTITLQGTGGEGNQLSAGVAIFDDETSVSSVVGHITITGLPANTAAATNLGILLGTDAAISSTGSATITLSGTGGPGRFNNDGIIIAGKITSSNGDISLTGQGGIPTAGSQDDNDGIEISGLVESTGAAKITLVGQGGSGSGSNNGVDVEGEIKSASGDITITGTGGPGTALNNGVILGGTVSRIVSVDGDISISGVAGAGTLGAFSAVSIGGAGIQSTGSATISISGSGNLNSYAVSLTSPITSAAPVQITGIAGASGCGIFAQGGINTSLTNANVQLIADCILIGAQPIDAGNAAVTIRPLTAGNEIDLGGTESSTTLALTDAELDLITAGTLQIGDANSGPITITADITRPTSTNINLTSNGSLNFTTGSINTAGGNLLLTPGSSSFVGVAKPGNDAILGPTGTLSFAPGSNLVIALNGSAVDSEYHQLNVAGRVDLTGVNLVFSAPDIPGIGSLFTIVNNDFSDLITGTFNGLPEGQVFAISVGTSIATCQITYRGGDGNDVEIRAIDPNQPELRGTPDDDIWLVKRNGNILEVRLNNVLIFTRAFFQTNSVGFDGLAGNDSLTVDLDSGDAIPQSGINFIGGDPATGPGDKLIITGGDQGAVNYGYTPALNGAVSMSNFGEITLTGLESILNTGTASDVNVLSFGGGATLTLGDDGTPGNNLSRLSGTAILPTDFANPTSTLTLTRNTQVDLLTVSDLPDFTAGLFIGSPAAPFGSVTFTDAVALAPNNSLSVQATGTISLPNAESDLHVSLAGAIRLTTQRNISLQPGSSISVQNGDLTLSANQQGFNTAGNFSGVRVSGSLVSTGSGNIIVSGRGGNDPSTSDHIGVHVFRGLIHSMSTDSSAGSISLTGQGGVGTEDNIGVVVEEPEALVNSANGSIQLLGFGGTGSTITNHGVLVLDGAGVQSTGTGSTAGNITILGAGGSGTDNNRGIRITGTGSRVTTIDGDISLSGQASALITGSFNAGVNIAAGAQVLSTGVGSSAGRITLMGTGGGNGDTSANTNQGVRIEAAATKLASIDGDVSITGIGGLATQPANTFADGVRLIDAAQIQTTGSANLTVTGRAGSEDPTLGLALRLAGVLSLSGQMNSFIGRSSMLLDPAALSIDAGANTVLFQTFLPIHLGILDDTNPNSLDLSDAELDVITAGQIQFRSDISITITADITRSASTNINLTSGEAINFTTGSINAAGGNLLLVPVVPGIPFTIGVANDGIDAALDPTGTLSFATDSDLEIAINGMTVDTDYHQLNVTGAVDLTGVDLVLSGTYAPATEDTFVIVNNDGSDAIIGALNGLDNGELFTIDTGPLQGNYRIVYDGGDGNDVVLTAINAAPVFAPTFENIAVNDENGPISIAFATMISSGPPRESSQLLEFKILSNTNESLFAVLPTIDAAGLLTFTPNFNVAGQATITLALQDNGGTASGGIDTSAQESFTINVSKLRVWHNARSSLDVIPDGTLAAADALEVINLLNAFGSLPVPDDGRPTGPYYDTNGDGTVAANDALDVINYLNAFGSGPAPEGEGEPTTDSPPLSPEPRAPSPEPLSPLDDLLTLLATDLATQPRRRK